MNSITNSPASPAKSGFQNLPAVVFFEGDEIAKRAITGLNHYLRLSFPQFAEGRQAESIVITSQERAIADKELFLRAPNVRVIALSDWKFNDPHTDGLVYAYLPVDTPPALLERTIGNALDHIHLVASRTDASRKLVGSTREIFDVNARAASISAEHDIEKLLATILSDCRGVTRADSGALYVVEEHAGKKMLRFKLTQNDSIKVEFSEALMEISDQSIAGFVALTAETVNLEDAYHLPEGVPYQINRKFDEDSGYRTKSVLAIPLCNQKGDVIGVVQLLNSKRDAAAKLTSVQAVAAHVVPFSSHLQELVMSLASQAAVALENARLIDTLQRQVQTLRDTLEKRV